MKMEVKDINNSVNPLLFNKNAAVAASGQALGAGFASLLGQTSMVMDILPVRPEVDVKPEVKTSSVDNRDVAADDKKTPASKADDKQNAASAEDKKTSKPSDDKNVKDNDKASSSENKPANKKNKTAKADDSAAVPASAEQQNVPQAPVAEEVNLAAAEVVVAENVVAENIDAAVPETLLTTPVAGVEEAPQQIAAPVVEAPAPVMDAAPLPSVEEVMPNMDVTAVIDGKEVKLSDFALTEAQIASAEVVTMVNAETGETVQMSGVEFLQQLRSAAVAAPEVSAPVAAEDAAVVAPEGFVKNAAVETVVAETAKPLETVEVVEDKGGDIAAPQVKAQAKQADKAAAYVDEGLAEQAVVLDEKLGGEQKVKVDVQVKEEKIAYTAPTDLVKDKITLKEALQAAAQDADSEVSFAKPSQLVSSDAAAQPVAANGQNAANVKANVQTVAPVMTAAVRADAADAVVSAPSSVSGVSEVSSAAVSHAGASGSEFVNAAKAEANAKTNDASFRDIYKGMSKEVVDQVKVNITKSAVKGVDKIDIQLKPEDLGHIEVKMRISKDGKLQAHIISSRPETMEVLQKEIQTLEKAFNDAGFQTDEGSLSFSFREGGQAGYEQERNSELRSFIGSVFENEANEELAGNDNMSEWTPAKGLNIRV